MPLQDAYAQASGTFSAAALFGAADITGTFKQLLHSTFTYALKERRLGNK